MDVDGGRFDNDWDQIHHKLAETEAASTADIVHDLALNFRKIGRRDDALRAEEDAVELYRKLMQTESARKDLGKALESLAGDLRALGREGDAVRIDAEVIELRDTALESPNLIQVADPGPSLLSAEAVHESNLEPAAAASELEGTTLEGTVLEGPSLLQAAALTQRHASRGVDLAKLPPNVQAMIREKCAIKPVHVRALDFALGLTDEDKEEWARVKAAAKRERGSKEGPEYVVPE
ncbi:hypothetical protein C8R44DRAFT_978447 [Mycena epipterygia]|nr:hypothetical protein C8R44DRAFT_978447 [Mycena epipterygia]